MLPLLHASAPISIPQASKPTFAHIDTQHHSLEHGAFSPVNEHGCFEFDRLLKAGQILKRGRKTKNYRPVSLVLRPLNISVYADVDHTQLRHSIPLNEVTAVARKRKSKRPNAGLFTIFTAPRNFHFDARTEEEADQWVYQIRSAAKVDNYEDVLGSSDEEGETVTEQPAVRTARKASVASKPPTHPPHGAFGASVGSFSSISSIGAANFPGSSISLSLPVPNEAIGKPNSSRSNGAADADAEVEQERVLRNGKLYLLKSKGGVKKWKPVWAVLRPKSMAIYPNDKEYSPLLIIPFPSIVNAVDIDSPSKNKRRQFCMQIITEERSWRLCALDEDDLARWLGGLKSLLAKRRET